MKGEWENYVQGMVLLTIYLNDLFFLFKSMVIWILEPGYQKCIFLNKSAREVAFIKVRFSVKNVMTTSVWITLQKIIHKMNMSVSIVKWKVVQTKFYPDVYLGDEETALECFYQWWPMAGYNIVELLFWQFV